LPGKCDPARKFDGKSCGELCRPVFIVIRLCRGRFFAAGDDRLFQYPYVTSGVRYGIENYFVPEGEGRALERPKPNEKVTIQVAVDRYGRAGIQAVLVNGQPRYVERLF
jgi:hypothetical protein